MSKILNKFLLTGDNFMPKLHLRQPALRFTYSAVDRLLLIVKDFRISKKQTFKSITIKMN